VEVGAGWRVEWGGGWRVEGGGWRVEGEGLRHQEGRDAQLEKAGGFRVRFPR